MTFFLWIAGEAWQNANRQHNFLLVVKSIDKRRATHHETRRVDEVQKKVQYVRNQRVFAMQLLLLFLSEQKTLQHPEPDCAVLKDDAI